MATTSTITAVLTTATTSVADHAIHPGDSQPSQPSPSLLTPSTLLPLLILISIPLIHSLASARRLRITNSNQEVRSLEHAWRVPWLTSDWTTLYGLIGLAQRGEIKGEYTPFHHEHLDTVKRRLGNGYGTNKKARWALHRLLERGVIPLRVEDGGVSTTLTRSWGVSSKFPWVILPRWQQTKKRGYFEFLIPHPERVEVRALLGLLEANQMNYNISCRTHNPKTKKPRTSITEPPVLHVDRHNTSEPLPSFPLSVGAESSCELLLPFLPDGEVERARGERIAGLGDYVREGEGTEGRSRVPLLHWSSWAVVRVEAAHWGYVELDHYVLGAVQDCGMGVTYKREICGKTKKMVVKEVAAWERGVCEKKALGEIERCGLVL